MRDIKDMSEEEILEMLHEDSKNIEPPESLSPASIERKLQGVKQIRERKKKSPWLIVAGMAACLAFGVFAGIITYSLIRGNNIESGTTVAEAPATQNGNNTTENGGTGDISGNTGAELSYENVCDIINNYNQNNRNMYRYDDVDYITEEATEEAPAAADEAAPAAGGDSMQNTAKSSSESRGTDDYSRTDEQVAGVEEGDIVKTDGKHIFTVEASTFGVLVRIIEPNGSSSKEIGTVEIQSSDCSEMYIYEDRLIMIGNEWGYGYDFDELGNYEEDDFHPAPYRGRDRRKNRTVITVVDISDPTAPHIIKTHSQTGSFNTSRISDGYLYTFTEDVYYSEVDYEKNAPEDYIPQIDGDSISSERIVRAGSEDTNNYMVMTSLSLSDADRFTDSLAALGGGATYYVSTEHIYIARINQYNETYLFGLIETGNTTTALTKFTYKEGKFTKDVGTVFRGQINNSYYMHEYQGNFCFVYTATDSDYEPYNGLCILDENMKRLGELTNIARGETIYASYYMGNMAYFVTYRNTDPVFAVDISDPTKPTLKSELKLPGFSSYLHSFGEGELIGIGYGDPSLDGRQWDNTTKLSLSLGQDYNVRELSKVFTDEMERNIADQNHKAIFIDEQRGLVGLGLINNNWDESSGARELNHYVVYQQKGDKLVKVMDSVDEKDAESLNIQFTRGVRIGNIFYLCDPTGVREAYTIGSNGEKWKIAK